MTQIPIIKGDKVTVKADYGDALPMNMYAVKRDILGAAGYMMCYPGLTDFATGIGADRGGIYNDRQSNHYRVSGGSLISVGSSGVVTTLGSVSGSSQAAMPYSFNTQAVIADGNMYLYSPSGGFAQVTDPDLGSPIDGVWVDGYYFLTDGEYIYHTDIADETAIDPTKYATAEFMPDDSLGVAKTQDNKVIVFGRYSIEYFVDVATEDFAFQRIDSRAQKIGIVATHAKCEALGDWYITGSRKNESLGVYVVNVGNCAKISTREIDDILSQYSDSDLSDMRMEQRSTKNVTFVIIHLPNETLCFNVTIANTLGIEYGWSLLKTGLEDVTYRGMNGIFDPRNGKHIYGDRRSTEIGYLDDSTFEQYGNRSEWYLYTPFIQLDGQSISELKLETIPGHTAYDDATVAVSTTYNGLTYGSEWWEMYGEALDYGKRFVLRRLGYVSDWVGFRFRGATKSLMSFAVLNIEHGD